MLRNTHLTTLRARRARPQTVPLPPGLDRAAEDGEGAPQAAAEASEVLAAVSSLPAPYRDALIAVDLVGLPYREACRALGVRGTLGSRLYRARRALLPLLGQEVDGP